MARWLDRVPLILIVAAIGAGAMYVPALHAWANADWVVARNFVQAGTLFLALLSLVALATASGAPKNLARSHLLAILATYTLVPLMLAVPLYEAQAGGRFVDAYVEMVSSLTTTGASFYRAEALAPSLHLWRALVGWMGGLFLWVTALAILAPLNLGGFEVTAAATRGAIPEAPGSGVEPQGRLRRVAATMAPIYAGLTVVAWLALMVAGEAPFVAACHAMSVLATSGISPVGGLAGTEAEAGARAGVAGEMVLFVFLLLALSRQTFLLELRREAVRRLWYDVEFRFGLLIVAVVPLLLFARHWVGGSALAGEETLSASAQALWGSLFTVLSFLTTMGFVSADWADTRAWSGLAAPGLILLGLAVFGGGVATTAGGVKLLRIYALSRLSLREMEKLVLPSSVAGAGVLARRIRREGAQIAFVFFMLFALSIAVVMVALSATGLGFEAAMVLAVAALTTTGPLAAAAADPPIIYAALSDAAKFTFAAATVLGRLETLAVIALLNPGFWRR